MITRRTFVTTAGATLLAASLQAQGAAAPVAKPPAGDPMRHRAIPATGERLAVIGMGTSGTFEVGAGGRAPLREVLARFFAGGGRVIDTAPSYGEAEVVLGDLLREVATPGDVFIATKLSSRGRDAGLAQFEASLARLRRDSVDLLQVHNLLDWRTQLALARELKARGKVRYVGLTHYVEGAQGELAAAARAQRPDFLQINYSPVSRAAEARVLPVARELGIAVLVNRTFEDGALFGRVRGKPVPAWAAEVGATSWAQLFLKFVLSEEAVTAVIPATSKPDNQSDNLKAGFGPLLDATQRAALVAALD